MKPETPPTIFLRDYKPAPYLIDDVELTFDLDPVATRIRSRLSLRPNPASHENHAALRLDGKGLALESIALNGALLPPAGYDSTEDGLTIDEVPQAAFTLEIVNTCNPSANTALSGLYLSNGIYCTQCEAEGFRRITYFYDRPDIMARYRVRIEADATTFPVLLSNGNPLASGLLPGGRHFALWDDPHPKPAYLFALVAGDLAGVHDTFITASGRKVDLGIHVERGKEDQCAWAMECLKTSMRWDEEKFGREYDLDVFNIVAVPHFNMGAMENKGLNIFNDKYILAAPDTAADSDYINIESIIAHEYFHNWTGNRITCRDWFQLCLKEGLTVFRDQEFSSDLRSRAVKRIEDVKRLRARQFPEDGGPLAHPVRPSSYIEINNFYTPTVYEKGAEICRMMQTLIGKTAFRKAMDLYFQRHDGEAATVEDFVRCMADASGRDLTQFFRWYEQAGTPRVIASGHYDAARSRFELTLEQLTGPTPGQDDKLPLHMPLGIGLVGPDGEDLPLDLEGTGTMNDPVIELRESKQVFTFRNVRKRPVVSINRGFSAPIQLVSGATAGDQLFLMGRDTDSFNRWEAGQALGRSLILDTYQGRTDAKALSGYTDALGGILVSDLDPAFKAYMLAPPSEADAAAAIGKEVDAERLHQARETIRRDVGMPLAALLQSVLEDTAERGAYRPDTEGTARRSLRQAALHLLVLADPAMGSKRALHEIAAANSMSAEFGAVSALVQLESPEREAALAAFHARHRGNPLLVDKWLMLNATAPGPGAAARIEALARHPDFDWKTPNRVYALISAFMSGNQSGFNAADGEGYRLAADAVLTLDPVNPQVAARVATGFRSWKMFDAVRRGHAEAQLARVLAESSLSKDVYEILSRIAAA